MKHKDLTFCFLIYKLMINGENQAVGTIRQFTWEDSFLIIGCCLVNPIQNNPILFLTYGNERYGRWAY